VGSECFGGVGGGLGRGLEGVFGVVDIFDLGG
jgi:hypothetical protein